MKKLLALLLAMLMMFSLVACGGGEPKDDGSKPSSDPSIVTGKDDLDEDDLDEDTDRPEKLILEGKEEYVVCIKKGSNVVINDIKDIKGLSVGFAYEGDGEKMAKFYRANMIGFGGENDAFSELEGGTSLDCVIVKKTAGEQYAKRGFSEIALDPIVHDPSVLG